MGFLIDNQIREFISNSPDETLELGRKIAEKLVPGSVAALEGTLGSGKTCLVRGIALGLGMEENPTSPTYTIINEYTLPSLDNSQDRVVFYHIDAYRLDNEKDFIDIGGDEIIRSGGISVIEWSERIKKSIPADSINIKFRITGPSSRSILITGITL
ncbi:MAG: tRNA (adenosine(37)-N6)-threonylcarbamoyltransferase complex ATPase subunit type 1 TsaE [Treponema sp.]|nr:tRNA (adenosine(37)-N6)-threonylcarbamoyltransferase complex ATPase subunit type 1 TsaE [Treponema sp.]